MLIVPPSVRSSRAVPDFTLTSLPLRRTVLEIPLTTSTRIGPLTAMAAPSIVPTESETAGSSERAVSAVRMVATANTATLASSPMTPRVRFGGMEGSSTQSYSRHKRGNSRLYYTSAELPAHLHRSRSHEIAVPPAKTHATFQPNCGDHHA